MSESTAVALPAQRKRLVEIFAEKYHIEAGQLLGILKATAFKVKGQEVSNEQMAALLVVANQYGLNPFTKEIFAFPDKQNGIVPVVGVDGWSHIINDHPQADGFEFRQSEETITLKDAKECPKWMEVVIYRKDRAHPIVVREYLDEVYRPPYTRDDGSKVLGPWQTHTKRFLRHKTLIQGGRVAFGFAGIYDEDEAARIIERDITPDREPASATDQLRAALGVGKPPADAVTDAEVVAGAGAPAAAPKAPEQAAAEPTTEAQQPAEEQKSTDKGGKPKGTKAQLAKFLKSMEACTESEILSLVRDDANLHSWSDEENKKLDEAYREKLAKIEGR